MSNKEIDRLRVVEKIIDRRLKQREAAILLNLSIRQVKRLVKRFKERGPKGLIPLKRGEPSNKKNLCA